MKGDFSRIIEGDYKCFLFEQGKPLTDSQLNATALCNAANSLISLTPNEISKFKTEAAEKFKSAGLKIDGLHFLGMAKNATATNIFIQKKLNTTKVVFEPIVPSMSGLGVVVTPHFFATKTKVAWEARNEKAVSLALKGGFDGNDLLRFEVHTTKDENVIHQIKWARANASKTFKVTQVEQVDEGGKRTRVTFDQTPTGLQVGQFLEFELEKAATIGIDLSTVTQIESNHVYVDQLVPEVFIPSSESTDSNDGDSGICCRVWDGMVENGKATTAVDNTALVFESRKINFELVFPADFHFVPGDYLLATIREGQKTTTTSLRNDGGKPEDLGIDVTVNSDGSVTIAKAKSLLLPTETIAASYARTQPENLEAKTSKLPHPKVVLSGPATCLDIDPQTLAVSRWLASMKLEEIASLSKSQLQDRIKRDCAASEYELETLDVDIDAILEQRSRLLGSTSLT